jgi:lysozyme
MSVAQRLASILGLLLVCVAWQASATDSEIVADPGLQLDLSSIKSQALKIGSSSHLAAVSAKKVVWGIDVSHHQGRIRWDLLRTQSLSFVYMKATQGDHLADPTFLENWQGASRAELARGAYHFYDFCTAGAPQASQFIRLVPRSSGSLPPAIDLEPSPACRRLPARRSLLKELSVFARRVRARYGKTPVVYVSHEMYDRYLKGEKHGYAVWISDYRGRPALSDHRPWTFWQCTSRGTIRGISGPVDVDFFRGSAPQFTFLGKPVKSLFAGNARTR